MRRSVSVLMLMITCGAATAEEAARTSPFASDELWIRQSACKGIGNVAEMIMGQRQKEVPMSEMISRLQSAEAMGVFDGLGITSNSLVALITAAYKQPAFSSADMQAEMIASFRNKVELPCFEGKMVTEP